MCDENELQNMPVGDLAQRCAQETQSYFNKKSNDSRYCLELFRRAIIRRDEDAWGAIYVQYQPQVERWVYRHTSFPLINQDAQDVTMQALERFLKYFTAEKLGEAKSLPAILNYLQMCVNGVILDYWRKMHRAQFEPIEVIQQQRNLDPGPSIENIIEAKDLWQLVQNRLKDEKERTFVDASIRLGYKPSQIMEEFPNIFKEISEIYQCAANLWARFKRDPELRKFLKLE